MNGVGRLIVNESSKLFHRTALKVFVIIIAVLIVLAPIASFAADYLFSSIASDDQYYYDGMFYDEEYYSDIERTYYLTANECNDFFKNNISDEWKYNAYYDSFMTLCEFKAFYKLICEDNYSFDEVNQYFDLYYTDDNKTYSYYSDFQDDYNPVSGGDVLNQSMFIDLKSVVTYTISDMYKYYLELYDKVCKGLIDTEYSDFAMYRAEQLEDIVGELANGDVSEEEFLKNTPQSNIEEKKQEYKSIQAYLLCYKGAISAYQKSAETDDAGWYSVAIDSILSSASTIVSNIPQTEKQFYNSNGSYLQESDYNSYIVTAEKQYQYSIDKVMREIYSVENGIVLPEFENQSAKVLWQGSLQWICSGVLMIFAVVFGAQLVSSEATSGTIRMLLIRPRKRWKILLSKYAVLLFYTVGLAITAYIVQLAISAVLGIISGDADVLTPDVLVFHGKTTVYNSLFSTFTVMLKSLINALVPGTLAFMLSTLTLKSALAIALPFVSQIISSITASILLVFSAFSGLAYSPLPYIDFTNYIWQTESIVYDMPYRYSYDMWFGLGIIGIILALMLFFSFLCFNKRQIKS